MKIAKISDILGKCNMVVGVLLSATLPLSYTFQQPVLWLFFITFFADFLLRVLLKRREALVWNRDKIIYIFFILFFLYAPVWQLFDPQMNVAYTKQVALRLPFLGFGIVGLLGLNGYYRLRPFAYTIIATFLLLCLKSFIVADYSNLFISFPLFLQDLDRARGTHMVFNLYANVALIMVAWLNSRADGRKKYIFVALMIFIALMLFSSDGRTGFITMCGIGAIYLYRYLSDRFARYAKLVLVAVALLFGAALFLHPKFLSTFEFEKNPRVSTWQICYDIWKDRPVAGWGVSSAREELLTRGAKNDYFVWVYANGYRLTQPLGEYCPYDMHPHNVFLGTMDEFGLVGLITILLCFGWPLAMLRRHDDKIVLRLLAFVFVVQACFESLGNHCPPLMYAYLLMVFYECLKEKRDENIDCR